MATCRVEYHSDLRVVECTAVGSPTMRELTEATIRTIALAIEKGTHLILLDDSHVEKTVGTVDIYGLPKVYDELTSDNPIDLCRYQVANCYMGKIGLINSGGASGDNDLQDAVTTAVINKRAGGMGLISGRKAFQKPMREGVKLLNAIQDVYLSSEVTIA